MTSKRTRLYFEAHITVEPKQGIPFDEFKTRVPEEWKASMFARDEVDQMDGQWFLSAKNTQFEMLRDQMAATCFQLRWHGFRVLRFKIEEAILDSKYEDFVTFAVDAVTNTGGDCSG